MPTEQQVWLSSQSIAIINFLAIGASCLESSFLSISNSFFLFLNTTPLFYHLPFETVLEIALESGLLV